MLFTVPRGFGGSSHGLRLGTFLRVVLWPHAALRIRGRKDLVVGD
jgi:hypothetical protein